MTMEYLDIIKEIRVVKAEKAKNKLSLDAIKREKDDYARRIKALNRTNGGRPLPLTHPFVKASEKFKKEEADIIEAGESLDAQLDKLADLLTTLVTPQVQVEELDDTMPIFLMPVKVETRFMTVKHITKRFDEKQVLDVKEDTKTGFSNKKKKEIESHDLLLKTEKIPLSVLPSVNVNHSKVTIDKKETAFEVIPDAHELWVRIFPDNIQIDSHEHALTKAELEAGKMYWGEVYLADSKQIEFPEKDTIRKHKIAAWRILESGLGTHRAAWVVSALTPSNFNTQNQAQAKKPTFPAVATKQVSWSEAPTVQVLPDKFVVRLYRKGATKEAVGNLVPTPLIVGLDPKQTDETNLIQKEGTIEMPDYLAWLTDFEAAEKVGMAIRIPLSRREYLNGFDELVVTGIRYSLSEDESKDVLEDLFSNHHYKSNGLSFVPQGTPTNNTGFSKVGKKYSELDAEETYETEIEKNQYSVQSNYSKKRDGQRLANALGIDALSFQNTWKASGTDIQDAVMMNRALWNTTMGYFLQQFIKPEISNGEINDTYDFFCNYVLGRGCLPAIRIGNQPYGILTASSYKNWTYQSDNYHNRLYGNVLKPLLSEWEILSREVKHIGNLGKNAKTVQENLLNILGLHASSVDYYKRDVLGNNLVANAAQLAGKGIGDFKLNDFTAISLWEWLREHNLSFSTMPKILDVYLSANRFTLSGPVVDGLPLSESRPTTNLKGGRQNYLQWLCSNIDYNTLLKEDYTSSGADEDTNPPRALLYMMLRHSLLRTWLESSLSITNTPDIQKDIILTDFEFSAIWNNKEVSPEGQKVVFNNILKLKKEEIRFEANKRFPESHKTLERATFIKKAEHRLTEFVAKETQNQIKGIPFEIVGWEILNKPLLGNVLVMEHIRDLIESKSPLVTPLTTLKSAICHLSGLPTAKLERLFAEHIDCCTYRLDAWVNGLFHERLEHNRKEQATGLYIGAYAWQENIRRNPHFPGIHIQVVEEPKVIRIDKASRNAKLLRPMIDLKGLRMGATKAKQFMKNSYVYLGSDDFHGLQFDTSTGKIQQPPRVNPQNQGFIPAPSSNHAIAAAILLNGYLSQKVAGAAPGNFAMNLSSRRIRKAIDFLQGMKNGQDLSTLLGYQFERMLHDQNIDSIQLDKYIYDFRDKYPVIAGKLTSGGDARTTAARNVVDGLALIEAYRKNTWNSGISMNNTDKTRLKRILDNLEETLDSISDLLMAESVYQMVIGNPARSAASLRILNEGGEIFMPEIVRIQQIGSLFTQHISTLHKKNFSNNKLWSAPISPRSDVEPFLNAFVANHLPDPKHIILRVQWEIKREDETISKSASNIPLSDLKIQPIDLLYMVWQQKQGNGTGELLLRIDHLIRTPQNIPDGVRIRFAMGDRTGIGSNEYDLMVLLPLLNALSEMVFSGKALEPIDLVLPGADGASEANEAIQTTNLLSKITTLVNTTISDELLIPIENSLTEISSWDEKALPTNADNVLEDFSQLLFATANYGMPNILPGFGDLDRKSLLIKGNAALKELIKRQSSAQLCLQEADSATSNYVKFQAVEKAIKALFGKAFKVFPEFSLTNKQELVNAFNNPNLLKYAGEFAIERWIQSLAPVRQKVRSFMTLQIQGEQFEFFENPISILQLPVREEIEDVWMGMDLPENYQAAGDTLAMALHLPSDFDGKGIYTGLLIDRWTEHVPDKEVNMGIAMHYDQPNTKPAQAVLLAVSPTIQGKWTWENLIAVIRDTMQLAKQRAVEPDRLMEHPFNQAFPTTFAPMNSEGDSPTLDYNKNNVEVKGGFFKPIPFDIKKINK